MLILLIIEIIMLVLLIMQPNLIMQFVSHAMIHPKMSGAMGSHGLLHVNSWSSTTLGSSELRIEGVADLGAICPLVAS